MMDLDVHFATPWDAYQTETRLVAALLFPGSNNGYAVTDLTTGLFNTTTCIHPARTRARFRLLSAVHRAAKATRLAAVTTDLPAHVLLAQLIARLVPEAPPILATVCEQSALLGLSSSPSSQSMCLDWIRTHLPVILRPGLLDPPDAGPDAAAVWTIALTLACDLVKAGSASDHVVISELVARLALHARMIARAACAPVTRKCATDHRRLHEPTTVRTDGSARGNGPGVPGARDPSSGRAVWVGRAIACRSVLDLSSEAAVVAGIVEAGGPEEGGGRYARGGPDDVLCQRQALVSAGIVAPSIAYQPSCDWYRCCHAKFSSHHHL
ncbi:hypothetical protein BC828DRAFT_381012 [Blastocladiella britannica]|nr:hypothetical protein BC828DRAFT_381012 [Blastocladiella britannica]